METSRWTNFNNMQFESIDTNSMVDVKRLSTNDLLSSEEVQTTIKYFLRKFNSQYFGTGPLHVSFLGSLNEALDHSLFEPTKPRPLILYLHHSQSICVNIFCEYVLCTEVITDYLAEEFLIWAWDRTLQADYSALLSMLLKYTTKEIVNVVASYPVDAYPLLVSLSVHQSQIDVLSIIHGTMFKDETMAELMESREKFDRRTELPLSKVVHTNLVSNANQSISTHLLKPLTNHSLTIDKIKKDFTNCYMQIVRIDQVENAIMLTQYLEQKKIIDTRLGHDQNEHLLFHGCERSAAENIIKHGFDHSLIGMHGTSYGHGFYFLSDHQISHHYTMPDLSNDGERTMLVCRVLVGRACRGNSSMRKCPNGYDSTTGSSNIYVVYSNEQILPEYIITYKKNYNIYDDIHLHSAYGNKTSETGYCTLF